MKYLKPIRYSVCLLCLFFSVAWHTSFGQIDPSAYGYYVDAFRFSQTTKGGTVRFQTLGGANTALGGDIANGHTNPAGLGFCRTSQFSLTTALNLNAARATFFGGTTPDNRLNVNIEHAGFLIARENDYGTDNKGGAFAISVSRINDFQQNITYQSVRDSTSIIDFFLEQTDKKTPWKYFDNQSNEIIDINALAYQSYLINPDYEKNLSDDRKNTYFSFVPAGKNRKEEYIRTRGGQYQWDFSYGGNYADRFYYGLGVGVQTVNYRQEREYTETMLGKSPLSSLLFKDTHQVTGAGVNLSLGLIFRPHDFVRIGLSGTTPTVIRLSEVYEASLTANYNNVTFRPSDFIDDPGLKKSFQQSEKIVQLNTQAHSTVPLKADYTLVSPYRFSAGIAFFAGKLGFLSADVGYVGYHKTWLTGGAESKINFQADNNSIGNLYKGTYNFKVGMEVRLDHFRIRGGAAYYDSPFLSDKTAPATLGLSAGIGIRKEEFYFDFGLMGKNIQSTYSPYTLSKKQPVVSIKENRTKAFFTFGILFL